MPHLFAYGVYWYSFWCCQAESCIPSKYIVIYFAQIWSCQPFFRIPQLVPHIDFSTPGTYARRIIWLHPSPSRTSESSHLSMNDMSNDVIPRMSVDARTHGRVVGFPLKAFRSGIVFGWVQLQYVLDRYKRYRCKFG